MTAGLSAGIAASLSASFGLTADPNPGLDLAIGAGPPAAGFSLAAAGGLGSAIESVKAAQADAGRRSARAP